MSERRLVAKTTIPPAWEPTVTTPAEVTAIKALLIGKASETQQRVFVEWLARATEVEASEFRPSGDRESVFAGGKRFVGRQFFSLATAHVPIDERHA